MTVQPIRPLDALGASLDNPEPVAGPTEPPPPPPSESSRSTSSAPSGGRGSRDRPWGEIWDGCPVKPMGVNGDMNFFLDALGQLRGVKELKRSIIRSLFGTQYPKLCFHFPVYKGKDEDRYRDELGFDGEKAASVMSIAVAEKGLFDPNGAVRGVGAWSDDDGLLVYHTGDRLLIGPEEREPSEHQGRIYPAAPAIPHPARAEKKTDTAMQVLDEYRGWQWERPDIDPIVLLGMTGILAFGGALDWRPAFWVTGGPGSGKSTLQRLILLLMGGEKGLIQSTDATSRGLASMMGQSTLPVALDELEPSDAGSEKEKAIVELARVASSGGRWMRGSSDQKGSSGQLRSTFLFSSVLIPGILKPQDLQRIIVLNLRAFGAGAKAPNLRADTWRERGAQLRRQIIERWPSWAARLEAWRTALADVQISGRNADNWATILAMAQMMRSEAMPKADEMAGWAEKISRHIGVDLAEMNTDADEVLLWMLTQRFDPFRKGTTWTVAQWLQVAGQSAGAPIPLLDSLAPNNNGSDLKYQRVDAAKAANNHLAPIGLRVIVEDGAARMFVANDKIRGLLDLFRDTQWSGGAWKQSLMRVPGAAASPTVRTLAGIRTRGTEVPFTAMPGLGAFPADRARPLAPPTHDGMEEFA